MEASHSSPFLTYSSQTKTLISRFPAFPPLSVTLKSTNSRLKRVRRSITPARALAIRVERNASSAGNIVHQEDEIQEHLDTGLEFNYIRTKAKLISFNSYVHALFELARERILSAFVDVAYQFLDESFLYCQRNFSPVNEIGGRVPIESIEGAIPHDFPKGVYVRNGPNPQYGAKYVVSPFGEGAWNWFEGDGMLHAVYFEGCGNAFYKNKFVESRTWKIENERGKPVFIPTVEGDTKAVLAGLLLNQLRFGTLAKVVSNTNVFQHGGRFYAIAENDLPHEIDISDLSTVRVWDCNGLWNHPFTAHPKLVPETGEMVVVGQSPAKPYYVLGIISPDGQKLLHKVDLKLDRCILSHEVAITERYNIIMDYPQTIDIGRLAQGGPLITFDKKSYARMGVMPRYGDAASVKWFDVDTHCTFHVVRSFEDGDEVILQGCRANESIICGPKRGDDKLQWFARAFKPTNPGEAKDPSVDGVLFTRLYEWRLNMKNGTVKESFLTGTEFSMDMPRINDKFVGLKNKYAYAQVVDTEASCEAGLPKYGKYVKLTFPTETSDKEVDEGHFSSIKEEFHDLGSNRYGSEPMFIARPGGTEEDDGWIIAYVHDETTDVSEVYIFDAQKFSNQPTTRIHLPQRVPYGYHGTFIYTY